MQAGTITLFRVRGIPIHAHWTLALVLPYLAAVLSADFAAVSRLAGVERGELVLPPLAWGAVLALGLFASVTVHELAHCFVARRFGGRVQAITLMLVGGVSQIAHLPRAPRQEVLVPGAGPFVSLGLGGLLVVGYRLAGALPPDFQMGLFYLGATNLVLGGFNLLPAFPMDGGRIMRAVLASRLGASQATEIAAYLGKGCAIVFGALGLLGPNVLLVVIAVFVFTGAQRELGEQRVRDALAGLRAVDLLPHTTARPTVDAGEKLDAIIARMHRLDRTELVVVDAWGVPLGVIDVHDLAVVDPDRRDAITAGDIVRDLPERHVEVTAATSANDALDLAAEADAKYLFVVESHVLGLVVPGDVSRRASLQAASAPER